MHLITEQLNHYQLSKYFIFLHRLIESHLPYLKKNRRDPPTPAKLPRSNKATGWVTKGQEAQPTYAGLANEVVPWIFACTPPPYI